MKRLYENETLELIKKLNQEEIRSNEKIKFYESQLNDSNLNIQKLIDCHEKQVNQLEKNIQSLNTENESNKRSIESLNKLNFEQQKQIQKLFYDIEEKNSLAEKQTAKKGDEVKRIRQSLNIANEKLKYQQLKYEADCDDLKKKFQKEIDQLKFSNEQAIIRNGELSRSNGEMRKRIQTMESDLKDLAEKCNATKHNTDILFKQKKDLKEENERTCLNLKKEIDVLQKQRDDYLKKTATQQTAIDNMIEQISTFQKDLESIVKQNEIISEKLKKTKSTNETYKKKYGDIKSSLKKTLTELENLRELRVKEQKQKQLISDQLAQIDLINNLIKELNLNVNCDLSDDSN